MGSDFCGTVPAGSKVMVVWGELQAGGEALQVRPYPKVIWLQLTQESHEKLITCDSIGLRGGPSKASGRPAKVKLEQLTSVKPLKHTICRVAVENSLRVGLAGHPKSSFNAIFSGCVGLATVNLDKY